MSPVVDRSGHVEQYSEVSCDGQWDHYDGQRYLQFKFSPAPLRHFPPLLIDGRAVCPQDLISGISFSAAMASILEVPIAEKQVT